MPNVPNPAPDGVITPPARPNDPGQDGTAPFNGETDPQRNNPGKDPGTTAGSGVLGWLESFFGLNGLGERIAIGALGVFLIIIGIMFWMETDIVGLAKKAGTFVAKNPEVVAGA